MKYAPLIAEYGFIFILYILMHGLVQSLCVSWIAESYIKPCKNRKSVYGGIIILLTLHDFYWSLYGYNEVKNEIALACEQVILYLAVYCIIKKYCVGKAIRNFAHLLAIEYWYQIVATIITFPVYIMLSKFNMEESASFLNIPSLGNALHVWTVYFATAWVARSIWKLIYKHRGRYYDVMCLFFCILDIGALWFGGWRMICVAFLTILYVVLSSFLLQNKSERALREQFRYYKDLAKMQVQREQEIAAIRHDIANHLSVMEEMKKDTEGQKILKKLDKKTRNFVGIPVLDCLIREKERLCEKEGITFTKEGDLLEESIISEYELVSLFANLLDNAIEASKNAVKKEMSLNVKKQQGFLKIVVKNTKITMQEPIKNNFKTTKKDKKNHGIGNKIIRGIVEKQGGRITYSDEGESMKVVVLIPQ